MGERLKMGWTRRCPEDYCRGHRPRVWGYGKVAQRFVWEIALTPRITTIDTAGIFAKQVLPAPEGRALEGAVVIPLFVLAQHEAQELRNIRRSFRLWPGRNPGLRSARGRNPETMTEPMCSGSATSDCAAKLA